MTVDARLKSVLKTFGDPISNGTYKGKATRYYTFNYSTLPSDYADDMPQHERYLVQVHLFAPLDENVNAQARKTKAALAAAGFQWPSVTNASDESGRHIVFETEISEGVELDGNNGD